MGYDIDRLIEVLDDFLGFKRMHTAVLFGVGSLGAALLSDSGLEQYGLKIRAGFDVDASIVGQKINNIPVFHSDEFVLRNKKIEAQIGVLTVPPDIAQEVADFMIEGDRGDLELYPFQDTGSRTYCLAEHFALCTSGSDVQQACKGRVAQERLNEHDASPCSKKR